WPACAAAVGPDHGRVHVGCHLHVLGIRAAGAGEWHTVTLTSHRPSPTESRDQPMTTDTSPRANRVRGGGQAPRTRGARPPGQTLIRAAEELFGERSYHRTT